MRTNIAMKKAVILFSRIVRRLYGIVRTKYYRYLMAEMGTGCSICPGVMITSPLNTYIGNRVQINERVIVQSSEEASVTVGDCVVISYGACILTGGLDVEHLLDEKKKHISAPIKINNYAWIGARAILLPGVTVGEKSIIAAGSVVIMDVRPGTMVAGVPAREIKQLLS